MKVPVIALFLLSTLFVTDAYSQLGRYEQPIDTISVGGEEQDGKMIQMERQDELRSTLVVLRDSVSAAMKSRPEPGSRKLEEQQRKIDELVKKFAESERDVSLMKEAETLVRETRQTLRNPHGE